MPKVHRTPRIASWTELPDLMQRRISWSTNVFLKYGAPTNTKQLRTRNLKPPSITCFLLETTSPERPRDTGNAPIIYSGSSFAQLLVPIPFMLYVWKSKNELWSWPGFPMLVKTNYGQPLLIETSPEFHLALRMQLHEFWFEEFLRCDGRSH